MGREELSSLPDPLAPGRETREILARMEESIAELKHRLDGEAER